MNGASRSAAKVLFGVIRVSQNSPARSDEGTDED